METITRTMESIPLWALGLGFFAIFWLAAFAGRWLRRRVKVGSEAEDGPGLVISASLGLLALLLGFTVSMAVSRYDGRRAATLEEANAIGTFVYRTDLMPPELRAATLAQLDRYVEARIAVGRMGESRDAVEAARAETSIAAQRMWDYMIAVGPQVSDTAVRMLLIDSANHMFDMATSRDAALANTLPGTLVVLLILFPVASLVLIGYTSGESLGAHLMASTELIILLTLVLLLIADLNRPRSGTIATPIAPMLDVQAQLKSGIARQAS